MGSTLSALLAKHSLQSHEPALMQIARRALKVETYATAIQDLSPTQSRFGGVPHVARGFTWPTWSRAGITEPLAHIATLNLEEIARAADEGKEEFAKLPANIASDDALGLLPREGLLSVWYAAYNEGPWGFDPKEAGGFQLTFNPDPASATELAELPDTLMADHMWENWAHLEEGLFDSCELELTPRISLPSAAWLLQFGPPQLQALAKSDAYERVLEALRGDSPDHLIGGFANEVQNTMELECELVSNGLYCGDATGYKDPRAAALEPNAKHWLSLFQIDTDDEGPRWMWGDSGMLYLWLTRQSLRAREFSKVHGILQCC